MTLAAPALATSWYVDGTTSAGRASTGTSSAPFSAVWMALHRAKPGDTIYVVPSMTYPSQYFAINRTAAAAISFAGSVPGHPTKISGGGVNIGILIRGNYLVIKNFDVTAPGKYSAIAVAAGFHHVAITGNVAHDAGAHGIFAFADDYITISNNTVYGNAKNTAEFYCSGISVQASVDIDGSMGTKMRITGNIIYANTNVPSCITQACLATDPDSDGSGIILDNNRRTQEDHVAYKGGFLVANNLIYHNGGRGLTDKVLVTGNTMWHNNQDRYGGTWHPGEITVDHGGKISIIDNIFVNDGRNGPAPSGTGPNFHVSIAIDDCDGAVVARNNLGYNPQGNAALLFYRRFNTGPVSITANLFADPQLNGAGAGNFRFADTSPPTTPAAHRGRRNMTSQG